MAPVFSNITRLCRGQWLSLHLSHFTPGQRAPGIHLTGCWVGLGASLGTVTKKWDRWVCITFVVDKKQ